MASRFAVLALVALASTAGPRARADPSFAIVGDAIPTSLTDTPGDTTRGRAIVENRQVGLCLLCHGGPFATRFKGDLAPDLAGAGRRLSLGQLRLRMVDSRRVNPETIMPPYFSTEGLTNVAAPFRDRTILTAQQIEDVVAFLATLRD